MASDDHTIRMFHTLTHAGVVRASLSQLKQYCADFNLEVMRPPGAKRCLKAHYQAVLFAYIAGEEYQRHYYNYTNVQREPYDAIPLIYRTDEVRRLKGIIELDKWEPEQKSLADWKRIASTNIAMAREIPYAKFSSLDRAELFRIACTMDVLSQAVNVQEIMQCLPRWPMALKFIPHTMQTEAQCYDCVQRSMGFALQHCAPRFFTRDLMELAIGLSPTTIQFIQPGHCVGIPGLYDYLCDKALAFDPWTIEWLQQTPERRYQALRSDWRVNVILRQPFTMEEWRLIDEGRLQEQARVRKSIEASRIHLEDV